MLFSVFFSKRFVHILIPEIYLLMTFISLLILIVYLSLFTFICIVFFSRNFFFLFFYNYPSRQIIKILAFFIYNFRFFISFFSLVQKNYSRRTSMHIEALPFRLLLPSFQRYIFSLCTFFGL